MPTYEFICPNGHDFEKFFRTISSAPSEFVCPVCGAPAQRRVSGGSGLVFKGSGFYITDYGKDGKKDLREKSGKTPPGEGSSSSNSSSSTSSKSSSPKPPSSE
jgi:putative FmdB family regulatory protein